MKYARIEQAAVEASTDDATAHLLFSELVGVDVLQAKVQVRCPQCDTHHGTFSRKSNVPNELKQCFKCESEFEMRNRQNWEVVYEILEEDADFFPDEIWHIKRYLNSSKDLPSTFFEEELERFREMENPQKRGRDFDYFVGLLFQQIEGVDVRIKQTGNSGEVDVFISCLHAPDWIVRLVGGCTLVENKWESNLIQKSEIIDFHSKASELANCETAYFVSMSGFSRGRGKRTGALANLRNCKEPTIIDIWEDDMIEMIKNGTPESLLKEKQMR